VVLHMLPRAARQFARFRRISHSCRRWSSSIPTASSAGADSAELGEVMKLVEHEQTSVSLERLVDFGTSRDEHTLLTAAKWLHRELPVRLAHRIYDLDRLPYGLSAMPSVRVVRDWYLRSLLDIRRFPTPSTAAEELQFTELLRGIYERHAHTLITMAKGVVEFKKKLQEDAGGEKVDLTDYQGVHHFLDGFYMSRVGIRVLIGQHLALHEEQRDDWVGLVCLNTSPAAVAKAAIEDARYMCDRQFGVCPDVTLHGCLNETFPFMPSHLHHILFEIIKNSLRAVVEFHGQDADDYPAVRVIVADSKDNEDVVIKVSDEGGGIARSSMHRIWSYFYTTAYAQFDLVDATDFSVDTPLAGLGYGLPLSRVFARYFGGDINIMSMEGYGTDAFLHLRKVGNAQEPLVHAMHKSL